MKRIDSFSGEYRFLSNFWPCRINFDGIRFDSVENAYVASKVLDNGVRTHIAGMTPGAAKRLGRALRLRPDFESLKLTYMEGFVRQKFGFGNFGLRQQLLATGDAELVEGNWWNDTFWGVCNGVGENNLGKILMQVRSEIK